MVYNNIGERQEGLYVLCHCFLFHRDPLDNCCFGSDEGFIDALILIFTHTLVFLSRYVSRICSPFLASCSFAKGNFHFVLRCVFQPKVCSLYPWFQTVSNKFKSMTYIQGSTSRCRSTMLPTRSISHALLRICKWLKS